MTDAIDEFVMTNLETYAKHKLQSIETFDAQFDGYVQHVKKMEAEGKDAEGKDLSDEEKKKKTDDLSVVRELSDTQVKHLADFMTKRLLGRIGTVKATTRLSNSPCMVADHESAQIRRLYKLTGNNTMPEPKYNLHLNPQHELIRKLYTLSTSTESREVEIGGLLAEQLFDNAIIAAGLLDDPRVIVPRVNTLLTRLVADVKEPAAADSAKSA